MLHQIENTRLFFYFIDVVACVSSCVGSKLSNRKLVSRIANTFPLNIWCFNRRLHQISAVLGKRKQTALSWACLCLASLMIGQIVRVMKSVSGNRCVYPSIIDGTLLIIHSWGCRRLEMVKAVDKSTFLLAGSSTANTNHFNSWNCFLAPTLKERSPSGVSECSQSSSSKKNS